MKKRLCYIMNTRKKSSTIAVFCAAFILVAIVLSGSVFAGTSAVAISATDIRFEKATEIALVKTGGGTIVKCELDYEDGQKVYEIKITNGDMKYSMDVAVADGNIYNFKEWNTKTGSESNALSITVSDSEISADEAQEIALAKAGSGTVVKCELDYENGVKVYEIVIKSDDTKYDMDVAASDGTIRDYEEEMLTPSKTDKTDKTETSSTSEVTITVERAKEIALQKAGGGSVVKCKLDHDDGRQVYEIEIQDGHIEYEIEIDAANGDVIEFDKDVNK